MVVVAEDHDIRILAPLELLDPFIAIEHGLPVGILRTAEVEGGADRQLVIGAGQRGERIAAGGRAEHAALGRLGHGLLGELPVGIGGQPGGPGREANLVVAEARGTRVYYRVDPAGIAALPLFLSMRAAIRAHVGATAAGMQASEATPSTMNRAGWPAASMARRIESVMRSA